MLNHSLLKLLLVSIGFSSSLLLARHETQDQAQTKSQSQKKSKEKKHKQEKKDSSKKKCNCVKSKCSCLTKNGSCECNNRSEDMRCCCSCNRKSAKLKKEALEKTIKQGTRSVEQKEVRDESAKISRAPTGGNFSSVTVTGNQRIGGDLTIGQDLIVQGTLTAENASTKSSVKIGGFEGCAQDGSLNIHGGGSVNDSLRVGECVNTHCLNAEVITTEKASYGSLTAGAETLDSLTVAKGGQFDGTLFTDSIDPLNGKKVIFSGNVSVAQNKKLLVNEINPVSCRTARGMDEEVKSADNSKAFSAPCMSPCQANCTEDDDAATCFSGNVAVHPEKILYTNEINPVTLDEDGHCVEDDSSTTFIHGNVGVKKKFLVNHLEPVLFNAICFSGNVAVDPEKKLLTNEIDPVKVCDLSLGSTWHLCLPDLNPCACTNFSGYLSVKNNHIIGQLDTIGKDSFSDQYLPINLEKQSIDQSLGYAITTCEPVLRLSFINTDTTQFSPFQTAGNTQQTPTLNNPFPQGAWVKLDITGIAQINFRGFSNTDNNSIYFDVFTELYFFVGPGNAAPCSAFVGTLNGLEFANTLSGKLCASNNPYKSLACTTPGATGLTSQDALFGFAPTATKALSAPAIIGITASSPAQPNSVDILLMGALPLSTIFNFEQDYPQLLEIIDPVCPFSINNLTLYFEVISPNVDQVCYPDPNALLDQSVYDSACSELLNCIAFPTTLVT